MDRRLNPAPKWLDDLIRMERERNINAQRFRRPKVASHRPEPEKAYKGKAYVRYDPSKRDFWFTLDTVMKYNGIKKGNIIIWECGEDKFEYHVSTDHKDSPVIRIGDRIKTGYVKVEKAIHNGKVFYVAPEKAVDFAVI